MSNYRVAILSRRRRKNLVASVDPLGAGNTALLGASGLDVTPFGFWDVRRNLTIVSGTASALGDVKGDGTYGPALAQATAANRPAWDGTTLNFDGVNDSLLSQSAIPGLDLSLNPCAYTDVIVADVGATAIKVVGSIGAASGTPAWSQEVRTGPLWQGVSDVLSTSGSVALPTPGSVRLFLTTFSYTTTPTKKMSMNAQVLPGAMSTNAGGAVGPEGAGNCFVSLGALLTGGANAVLRFRARLILPGILSAGQVTTLATWANTYHLAVTA